MLDSLKVFGATDEEILLFESSDYRIINYVSLIDTDSQSPLPEGVIESDGRPIMYFIDNTNLAVDPPERTRQIRDALNILACRGEFATLAIVSHGQLTIYPISASLQNVKGYITKVDDDYSNGFIRDLVEGVLPSSVANQLYGNKNRKSAVEDLLFSLLMRVGEQLNATIALKNQHEIILALIGRALLTRFLLDRKIITKETFPQLFSVCNPEDCFSNPKLAALVNAWLDSTFNGDLLELPVKKDKYITWFTKLDSDVFNNLSFILCHLAHTGQKSLPGFIDFAHVPVGLLSEVYERYAHENLDQQVRNNAKKESIHYTPRHIADYMLTQAFDAVSTSKSHESKILDPSCGAGVFVVLAFRRLIAENWKITGKRPDTYKIREILYDQLAGFDINKSALTLAALGLYLSALELDPEPLPTSKLSFKTNLIGSVLHCVREENEPWPEKTIVMGSLGTSVSSCHIGRYDIVIGNPPWSNFPKEMGHALSLSVRDVAKKREPELLADIVEHYENPDHVPDLPFVWKSMEWAKQSGTIALALHARLLFKNSPKGLKARSNLFKALNITGILNGAALRQSNVWPRVTAQFCLLFAKNEIPTSLNYFHFISPQYERELNEYQGRIRVDYQSAQPIQASALEDKPYLLKALYKGTVLDVNVVAYIQSLIINDTAVPLKQYWDQSVGKKRSGVGLKTTSTEMDASFLIEMNAAYLSKKDNTGYLIDTASLSNFNFPGLHRTREKTIYEPPLVLISKAIGADGNTVTARISLNDRPVAYNESFFGYSACGHPSAESLAKYLFTILNSDLLLYYTLMISSQYGIEREVVHKSDIDSFPIIPYENLSKAIKTKIEKSFDLFKKDNDINILNNLIFSIYGLSKYDQTVIQDTLSVALPVATSKKKAQESISDHEIIKFCNVLTKTLEPHSVHVHISNLQLRSWRFISISTRNHCIDINNIDAITEIANNTGASKVMIVSEKSIHIGMLNQYRYWTPSRARLLALDILKDHSDQLGLK